jgi:hypothetical protein
LLAGSKKSDFLKNAEPFESHGDRDFGNVIGREFGLRKNMPEPELRRIFKTEA